MEKQEGNPRYGIVNFERRRHPRFNIDLPIEYSLVNASISHSGRAKNISEGGLLIYLPEKVEIGRWLRLKLFLPSGRELNSIEMLAEVVWIDIHFDKDWGEYRSGLRFIDISLDDLNRLKNFLRNLSL